MPQYNTVFLLTVALQSSLLLLRARLLCRMTTPAAAICSWSPGGAKLICHVSDGCVSMIAFVELSFRFHTRMNESRALEAAKVPVDSTATDTTPSVCPVYVCFDSSRSSVSPQSFTLSSTEPAVKRSACAVTAPAPQLTGDCDSIVACQKTCLTVQ